MTHRMPRNRSALHCAIEPMHRNNKPNITYLLHCALVTGASNRDIRYFEFDS